MFHKKPDNTSIPTIVTIFRMIHGLLILHALAIIGITFFLDMSASFSLTPERIFAMAVAIPIVLGSCAFLLTTTARILFMPGMFFCSLLAFILTSLPLMMNVFFPIHLVVCALAAVYGISCIILAHFFFAQPVPKKR